MKKEESKTAFLMSKMDLPAKLASIASKKESRSLDGSSDGSLLEASQPRSEHLDRDAFRLGEFLQNQLEVGLAFSCFRAAVSRREAASADGAGGGENDAHASLFDSKH